MHPYTFPYKEGKLFRDLERGFGGGKRFMKTLGFRFLNSGFRNLRLAVPFWRGFLLDRGLTTPIFLRDHSPLREIGTICQIGV